VCFGKFKPLRLGDEENQIAYQNRGLILKIKVLQEIVWKHFPNPDMPESKREEIKKPYLLKQP
jgi:hypothetical protein